MLPLSLRYVFFFFLFLTFCLGAEEWREAIKAWKDMVGLDPVCKGDQGSIVLRAGRANPWRLARTGYDNDGNSMLTAFYYVTQHAGALLSNWSNLRIVLDAHFEFLVNGLDEHQI